MRTIRNEMGRSLRTWLYRAATLHQQEEFLQTKAIGFMWII